jgi:hypothetical protein
MVEMLLLKKEASVSAGNSESITKRHRLNKSDFYPSVFSYSPGKSFIDPSYDPFNNIES